MTLEPKNLKNLLLSLWRHVESRRKIQLIWLIVLMVAASFAEVLSLGALLPFLGALTSPDKILSSPKAVFLVDWFGIHSPKDLLKPLTIIFCITVFIAAITRLVLLRFTTKLSYALGADLSISVYRKTLYQPYLVHVSRNTSELISGIATKTSSVILHVINPLLIAISSTIILLSILSVLVVINPLVALILFFGFGLLYLIIIKLTKNRLIENSQRIAEDTTSVVKSLQEGLGGIRDVLLGRAPDIYGDTYTKADHALRRAQASNFFIGNSPRFVIEASGMILISLVALQLAINGSETTIMVIGLFALGAQRLLPLLQQLYNSWTTIKGNEQTLRDIINLLDQQIPYLDNYKLIDEKLIRLKHNIELDGVSFSYASSLPTVIKDISLLIHKGDRVGFIGTTGSGKSTLLDILMALLVPTSGSLKVDGVPINQANAPKWQLNIAHVPQSIYLMDCSIAENIAFGERKESIDIDKVRAAAQKAQIAKTIESWRDGYDTMVGEKGIKLSGGQRQRIAIARALYRQADLIVFDEATSALDQETEELLMEAIQSLSSDLTVLIIAHRTSTLRGCNIIVELRHGQIVNTGSYNDLITRSHGKSAGTPR